MIEKVNGKLRKDTVILVSAYAAINIISQEKPKINKKQKRRANV